jgi:uncharacterized protein HemX
MKSFLQWASLILAVVAVGISIVTYTQVQSLRTGDHLAAEAVERLRQDIATELAKKRVSATEQAQALQQGLTEDLKKLQEVSKDYLKPVHFGEAFSSVSPSPSTSPKK